MVLLGLLYGRGDMEQTVVISMRGGYDSDCNPSSAAGVVGTMIGFSKLPAHYTKELKLEPKFSYTAYNVPALLDVCERLARQTVVQQGGRIERDADGKEWFVIPVRPAQPGPLMLSWAPGPIAGSRFTEEEYAIASRRILRMWGATIRPVVCRGRWTPCCPAGRVRPTGRTWSPATAPSIWAGSMW